MPSQKKQEQKKVKVKDIRNIKVNGFSLRYVITKLWVVMMDDDYDVGEVCEYKNDDEEDEVVDDDDDVGEVSDGYLRLAAWAEGEAWYRGVPFLCGEIFSNFLSLDFRLIHDVASSSQYLHSLFQLTVIVLR